MTREEAIRRIKAWNLDSDDMEVISAVIPELAESEDEKIKKGLIELIENWNYPQELFTTKQNIIAYLEKPKEPIDPFDTKLFQDGVKEGRRLERDDIMKEQKPAEWSDEDNIGWGEAFACVTRAEKAAKNEEELQNAVTAEKWLKEIKFKYYVHPVKQEWSEEDENNLELVIDCIYKFYPDPVMKYKLKEWLKSLRPSKDCSDCAKHLEGYISGRSDAENKLLEQFGALVTPEDELHIKPRWKPSEDEERLINTSISFLKDFADKGYENAVECIDWLKSKLNGNSCE